MWSIEYNQSNKTHTQLNFLDQIDFIKEISQKTSYVCFWKGIIYLKKKKQNTATMTYGQCQMS